jgi:hypothetical protein
MKLIPNAFSLYFIIGHSVFDIGYSSLKLIAMGNAPGAEPPPKHRPERAELQRKPRRFSPYRAESFHTFTHGAAMGCRVSAPLGRNAEFNTKVSTTFEACPTMRKILETYRFACAEGLPLRVSSLSIRSDA